MTKVARLSATKKVRSVFISDVHLGFPGCSADFLTQFLKQVHCENLYLVGDIIDFWYLRKKRYWPQTHSDVVRQVLSKAKHGVNVVFIPGNHDEVLRSYGDLDLGNIQIRDQVIHTTADGRRMLVLHGDQFDSVVRCSPILAKIGSHLYDLLLKLNVWINGVRKLFGRSYWSLAAFLKHKVKNAVQYISSFEEVVVREAAQQGVEGVICGHIHRAEITEMNGMTYMNCGDWVESCTALVEHQNGEIELVQWRENAELIKNKRPKDEAPVTDEHPPRERAA